MDTKSLWQAISKSATSYPTLMQNIDVDIAIIGGGITGITTAYELANKGVKVALVEANTIGSGTTGNSTGNLYIAVQPYYYQILKKFDQATVTLIAQSRRSIIDYIENMVKKHQIACNFARRPWYIYTDMQKSIEALTTEVETLKKADIAIQFTDDLDIPITFKRAAVMENQARFNPLQYVRSMAEQLNKQGVTIFENTPVLSIEEKDGICSLHTQNGTITAKKVVMATHTPKGINHVQMLEAPYRSYVVAVQLKDIYPVGHYWDFDEPKYIASTHSVYSNDIDILLLAGNHHKTGQSDDTIQHIKKLEAYLYSHYPIKSVDFRWSAQHYQAADDVPYIGLASMHAKNVYMATGFFADGLVYGTLAGIILADLLTGKTNKLAETYRPQRFEVKEIPTVMKENMNVFCQYLKDVPIFTGKKSLHDLKPGDAKIVSIGGEKCGVYCDEQGHLQAVSAVCTHMKCIVSWNNAERTWDCPCHGSRFTTEGKVIEGPALANLKRINLPEEK